MKIVYIDMDDTLCDYKSAFEQARRLRPDIEYPQSQPSFFISLSPLPNAIDAMQCFLADERYDPYILTAPSVKNPLCYTEKRLWVEEHLGFAYAERLIISPIKGLLVGDYLIDDYVEGKGQESFQGELIHFSGERFKDWNAVMRYFALSEAR
ncbi:hypothetical protein [Shewanella sp. 4_MG-2023]|uniref:5' nucleotidase, NT5C type n=1 Tax=Shewanella sp. 4_MG-2023 TaxID=3062652 RepID=UPI0026E42A95|nr:hypothetical protein [Shewanella sp. 4_MG-2023]MDO6680230.1 hypothetical protein [Shewanella sp. 4_MG-2023]